MTLLDPIRSVETLIYIGYGSDPSSAFHVTRRRRLDRKKQQTERTVYQCFVFGPKETGKSALLNAFIGRYVSGYAQDSIFKWNLFHVFTWMLFHSLKLAYQTGSLKNMLQQLAADMLLMLSISHQ